MQLGKRTGTIERQPLVIPVPQRKVMPIPIEKPITPAPSKEKEKVTR